ncbi:MAG: hypothetical protein KC619_16020 [Myxococcales bacterium]|nr:hypothetical protein [Myxococcales bacterium]
MAIGRLDPAVPRAIQHRQGGDEALPAELARFDAADPMGAFRWAVKAALVRVQGQA